MLGTRRRTALTRVLVVLAAASLLLPAVVAQGSYYANRTVELVVPFSPGGGNDAFARFLQGYMVTCIPDRPTVQVVNVPGGGTVIGANEFELLRPADGTSVLVTSGTTPYAWLLGQQGVRFSPLNWEPLLGLPGGGVIYANPRTGVQTAADLLTTDAELVYGGITAVGLDLLALLTFEIIGANPKVVLGYEGKGPGRIAFEQGEINLDYQTTPAYIASVQPLVDAGTAIPLYTLGHVEDGDLVRDPAFPEIPSFKEAYEEVHGAAPSGLAWDAYLALVSSGVSAQRQVWVLKNSPPEAIAELKAAMQCAIEDPTFFTAGQDLLAGYEPIVGERLDRSVQAMLSVSPDVLDWLRNYVSEEFGVDLN